MLQVALGEVAYELALGVEGEGNLGVDQCNPLELAVDVSQLCLGAFEEASPCGDVIKEILHRDRGAYLGNGGGGADNLRSIDQELVAYVAVGLSCD